MTGLPAVPEAAWDQLWLHLREAGGGVTTLAMAAIDIALWDLRGRAAGLGLPDLLGRQRDQVPAYASGVNRHLTLAELTERTASRSRPGTPGSSSRSAGGPSLAEELAERSGWRPSAR